MSTNIFNPQDWNELNLRFENAEPFPSIYIDNFLDEEFSMELAQCYPSYNDAKQSGREFQSLNQNLKTQITEPSNFPAAVAQLSKALSSEEFLQNMSTLSGIPDLIWDPSFTGGGMHLTNSSGLLDVHVDFNYEKKLNLYRRLNILIYLNPTWEEQWGGNVELWDKDVKNCIHSLSPIHNRCVIFSTSDYSFHGVTAVNTVDNVSRNSFAAYFYSKDAGDNAGTPYGGNHSTIFKARPYEYEKKYWSMPLKRIKAGISNQKNIVKAIIKDKIT
jgi:Rps23 Pro-64 3,4-dihydroxylase Tpa1-like proline 4-hydroxylase